MSARWSERTAWPRSPICGNVEDFLVDGACVIGLCANEGAGDAAA